MTSRTWIAQAAWWLLLASGINPTLAGSIIPAADTTPPPYLGLRAGALPPPHDPASTPEPGLRVLEVDATGPVAGLVAPQDVLHSINGQLLFNVAQWRALLSTLAPGANLELVLSRQDLTQRVAVVLGARTPGLLVPWPEFEETPAAEAPPPEGDTPAPDATDTMLAPGVERVDALLDLIRNSYENSLPTEGIDPILVQQFMDDVRKHLSSSDLNAPLHPDAYRVRPLPNLTPTGEKNLVTQGGAEANLVISIRDGQKVYTYRDADGNVIEQGALDTREDRELIPLEVWKKLYELERAEPESTPGTDATRR